MAVDRFAGATCCARWMLFIALCACSGAATTPNPTVGAPAGVGGGPSGPCIAGQATACNTVACTGGVAPTAICSPTGTQGPCACPTTAGTAGTGSPVGGMTPTAGRGGSGTVAGNGAGGMGTAAVGGQVMAGTGGVVGVPAGTFGKWPMMGYDPGNNYHNTTETIMSVATAPMLKEKWRTTIAGNPPGTPIIADGRVFVLATGGTYALSLADGKILWSRTELAGTSSVAYADGAIYVHIGSADLYRLNPVDGKTVWGPIKSFATTDCDGESSPIVANGMVFVGHSCGPLEISFGGGDFAHALGGVEAFNAETGARVWSYQTVGTNGENGAMVWSTVSVDVPGKTLFAGTGNNYSVQGENSDSIHAVDLMTGMRMWKTQVHNDDTWSLGMVPTGPDTDFGANPILAEIDGKQVVADGTKGSSFHMLDRKTGMVIWQRDNLSTSHNQANGGILMNGAFDGTYFYAVSNQPSGMAVLHAMDPRKMGADAWPAKTFNKLTWGALSVANGVLFVPSNDQVLVMNAMTGDMLAQFTTGGTIAGGAAAVVDGNVVVGSGLSYALDPTTLDNNLVICYAVPGAKAPDLSAAGGPTMPTFTPGSATWSAIYQEIVVTKGCNGGPSCHASSAGGKLVMQNKADAYTALVGVKAMGSSPTGMGANCVDSQLTRVVAGDPNTSLLVNKVEQATPSCGQHMPPGGMLTPAEIKQIRDWITAGAMNN
jgi:hypothetical protein